MSTLSHGRHQTSAENEDVPSPASSVCKHARVAFRFLRAGRAKKATPVVVGNQRIMGELVNSIRMAEEKKYLSAKDATALVGVADRARVEAVWPLVKMGDTGFYAVYEGRGRTCELNWANVKDFNPSARGENAGASRRMSNERRLMCKANKGVACSENKARKRTKCVHTLLVALALWRESGMGTEGLDVGGDGSGEEGGDDGEDPGGASCQHTAQILIDNNGQKYARDLANSFNFMSIYKLPPSLPGGVMSVKATNGVTYTTSQQKCSTCRGCFSPAGVVEAAKLVTREPGMATVRVERWKCEQCGTYAWASDDWRKTGVYNYNNHLLIEMSPLYSCRDAFVQGTPIQTFFATFLERLQEDCDWSDANPDLDNSLSEGTNLLNSLKNAFLSFLAVTDFGFEYRCWIWGNFPEIVTFDGCMKVSTNFVTKRQLMASRPEQTIDVDLVACLLKLSLVSPIHFGKRVQFVVGAGETVGSSPAWMGPGNRLSERFLKTQRGSLQHEKDSFKNGNGAALVEWLAKEGKGIGYVDEMELGDLRNLHKLCFSAGGSSKFSSRAGFREEFKKLHSFWDSDGNTNRGSCSKLSIGRDGAATTGVLGAFAPSGIMLLHKTLLTEESPRDVSDFAFSVKRAPVLIVYDAACKAAAQIARRRADMLENGGKLPRLGGDGGAVAVVEGPEGTGEPHAKGDDGASSLPRVYLPQLAHLGSHGGFNSLEVRPCSFPVEPVRESTADVYALKEASLPQPGVQSRVDVHELLRQSSNKSVLAGRSSFLAATRSLACLLRDGIRTLSLFEVLVFTYHWLRKAQESGFSSIDLAADGWTLEVGPPSFSVWNAGSGAMPSLEHEEGREVMGATDRLDAEKFLYELLIVAAGARNGKVPLLPSLLGGGESGQGDLLVDKDGTSPFPTVVRGLLSYAKAKEDFVADGLKPNGGEERRRAGDAVRSGVGFGAGVFSVKSLQVHLAAGVAPHESTKEDKVAGYDAIFHDTTFDDSDFVVPGEGPRPHPYLGRTSGIFLGPDGPHEKNHNPQCTRDHSGLTKCLEIAGVNLNPHEQDHAKKHVYLRSINTMAFPNFTFALRVINELQNEGINRRTLGRVLRSLEDHPIAKINACHKSLWFCGRCFCLKPTIRVFDSFGRVDVVFLSSVIDAAVRR